MPSTAVPTPSVATVPIHQRTARERLAGATLEFLDAKSRNSAAALVGEGFRRLCERWGLSAADWETEHGSVARALVDEATAHRLADTVSDLLVLGYLARVREVSGDAKRDLDLATIRLVDWLDRFTPFRFLTAWAARDDGPTGDFWSRYVDATIDEVDSLDESEQNRGEQKVASSAMAATSAPSASVAHWLDLLRNAIPGGGESTLQWETAVHRVSRLCEFAPPDDVMRLTSRLRHGSLLALVAEAPKFSEPKILARHLVAEDPKSVAIALYALELFPALAPRVALAVVSRDANPLERSSGLFQALSLARGGILARFVERCAQAAPTGNWKTTFIDDWKRAQEAARGHASATHHESSRTETGFASRVEWVVAAGVSADVAGSEEVFAASRARGLSDGSRDALARRAVRLALRLGEPGVAQRVAERLGTDHAPGEAASRSGEITPDLLVAEEAKRTTLSADRPANAVAHEPVMSGGARQPTRDAARPLEALSQQARCFTAGAVRSRAVDLLLLVTGLEVVRFLVFAILWLLGLRRDGTMTIDASEIRVATRTSFLGREIRSREIRIPATAVRGVVGSKAWRVLYLLVGLVAIAVFTLLGVSAIFDGVARQHIGIITFGSLIVLAGLITDGACYWLFLRGGERVFVRVDLAPPARPIRLWIARDNAADVIESLATLAKSGVRSAP
ncbi:MAG: hypothetical protein HYY84_17815 [Deltaproteobacteria bacterium]|nr:hypothetical protein [Deltaproteobacteria bacterium]